MMTVDRVEIKNIRFITQSDYINSSCKQCRLILVSMGLLDEGASRGICACEVRWGAGWYTETVSKIRSGARVSNRLLF